MGKGDRIRRERNAQTAARNAEAASLAALRGEKIDAAVAEKMAANPSLRLVRLADLPPVLTEHTPGEFVATLKEGLRNHLARQGQIVSIDQIDPFQSEPCAIAVMLATDDELQALRIRLDGMETWQLRQPPTHDQDNLTKAVEKLLESSLPELDGRIQNLERKLEEAEANAQRAYELAEALADKHGWPTESGTRG